VGASSRTPKKKAAIPRRLKRVLDTPEKHIQDMPMFGMFQRFVRGIKTKRAAIPRRS
jgi:hypothetical protein